MVVFYYHEPEYELVSEPLLLQNKYKVYDLLNTPRHVAVPLTLTYAFVTEELPLDTVGVLLQKLPLGYVKDPSLEITEHELDV